MWDEAVISNKAWIGAAAFAALFISERITAFATAKGGTGRLFKNGALWVMLMLLSPLIVLPLTKIASDHTLWIRPTEWPVAKTLFADVIILDVWAYAVHRAYHNFPLMWRLHRVHHLDEHLDTTSAVRFHPGEVALSAALRMFPIFLLSIPFTHVVLFETALLAATIFHHSNLRLPPMVEKVLSRIIVTPSIHWVHHHAVKADTNSNYAAILSLWDPLFGTRSATRRTRDLKIGIEGVADKSLPGLLLAPFQPAEKQ